MSSESEISVEMALSMLSSSRAEIAHQKSINNNLKELYEDQLNMILNLTTSKNNIELMLDVIYKLKRIYGDVSLTTVEKNLKDLKEGNLWTK